MQSLRNLRRVIEEQLDNTAFKALVEIHYDSEFTVTQILDQVRALCGIIIVNAESSESLTDRKEKVLTKVKFYTLNAPPAQYIAKMVDNALAIDGLYAFRVKKVQKITKEG
tara:strand:- start:1801 stop:2133 length:333 start_codon:yes stop_codon:yes gene_type:complete